MRGAPPGFASPATSVSTPRRSARPSPALRAPSPRTRGEGKPRRLFLHVPPFPSPRPAVPLSASRRSPLRVPPFPSPRLTVPFSPPRRFLLPAPPFPSPRPAVPFSAPRRFLLPACGEKVAVGRMRGGVRHDRPQQFPLAGSDEKTTGCQRSLRAACVGQARMVRFGDRVPTSASAAPFAPHPPFGHPLPARGERENRSVSCSTPRRSLLHVPPFPSLRPAVSFSPLAGRRWPKAG